MSKRQERPQLPTNVRYLSYALHVVAIPLGIWVGILIYEWMTGSSVSIGFR